MKYYRYVKVLLLISSGFFLHSIYEWVQDIVIKHNLFSNGIDFFGNVIVAAGSAAIAYIISNYQLKKSKIEMEYVSKKETISKLQLIKLEIDTNKKVIQNISESDNYTYAIETAKEKISCNIWKMYT